MKRKLLALLLVLALCQALALPALAVVEEISSIRVDDVISYSREDGIYTVMRDGLYGFYFADGTELLAPVYTGAEDFSGGMAAVSLPDREEPNRPAVWGYIDTTGTLAVPMRYQRAFPFCEDRAFAVQEQTGALALLDTSGRELAVFPDAELQPGESVRFSEGIAVLPVRGAEGELVYQAVNTGGQILFTFPDACVDFQNGYRNGLIAVAERRESETGPDGQTQDLLPAGMTWGYRDSAGALRIPCQFDRAAPFAQGLAAVGRQPEEGGEILYGFIDRDGATALPLVYEAVTSYENDVAAVCQGGKWGFVDLDGRNRTAFVYDGMTLFREEAALVRTGSRQCVINPWGRVLFFVEEEILPYSGGVAAARNAEGLWGIYDSQGNLLVPFDYDRAYHWDGYLWLKRGDLWRVYRTEDVLLSREDGPEGVAAAAVGVFTDVPPEAYYAAAVTWATDRDIMAGAGGGQFSPDRTCTVGEVLTFLWRAVGRPEPSVENPFTDVSPNNYYYQAALWAYENGMVEGETFGAAALCTRGMAVTYFWLMAGAPAGAGASFEDVPADAAYAQAVAWAVAEGITDGDGSGAFSPDSICSRGQIVTFLYRYLTEG